MLISALVLAGFMSVIVTPGLIGLHLEERAAKRAAPEGDEA